MVHLLKTKKGLKCLCKQEIQITSTRMTFDKACFQCDVAYEGYKDLTKKTQADKV